MGKYSELQGDLLLPYRGEVNHPHLLILPHSSLTNARLALEKSARKTANHMQALSDNQSLGDRRFPLWGRGKPRFVFVYLDDWLLTAPLKEELQNAVKDTT